jgi:hypothetical protein
MSSISSTRVRDPVHNPPTVAALTIHGLDNVSHLALHPDVTRSDDLVLWVIFSCGSREVPRDFSSISRSVPTDGGVIFRVNEDLLRQH